MLILMITLLMITTLIIYKMLYDMKHMEYNMNYIHPAAKAVAADRRLEVLRWKNRYRYTK